MQMGPSGDTRPVVVVGTGSWGTTLAVILARREIPVTLLCRTEREARKLRRIRKNRRFLPLHRFPPSLSVLADPGICVPSAGTLIIAAPSQRLRENIQWVGPWLVPGTLLISASKGLELHTHLRMSQVIAAELGAEHARHICAISGPNLSREVAAGKPATTVAAAFDLATAECAQDLLMSPNLRVYTNSDLIGVELGGSLKNIIALGAGIADGLKAGDNAKAAFITRGLAEISRLGVAAGADPLTFAGLAGLGDLVATCASPHSRNRYLGEQLAKGRPLDLIQQAMGRVVEGVPTTVAARELARTHGVEMPITEQIYQVLFEHKPVLAALSDLMLRDRREERERLRELGKEIA